MKISNKVIERHRIENLSLVKLERDGKHEFCFMRVGAGKVGELNVDLCNEISRLAPEELLQVSLLARAAYINTKLKYEENKMGKEE